MRLSLLGQGRRRGTHPAVALARLAAVLGARLTPRKRQPREWKLAHPAWKWLLPGPCQDLRSTHVCVCVCDRERERESVCVYESMYTAASDSTHGILPEPQGFGQTPKEGYG